MENPVVLPDFRQPILQTRRFEPTMISEAHIDLHNQRLSAKTPQVEHNVQEVGLPLPPGSRLYKDTMKSCLNYKEFFADRHEQSEMNYHLF